MKIQVRNYQAIQKADLEFEPGINMILGNSNEGKCLIGSTVVRAEEGLRRLDQYTYGEPGQFSDADFNVYDRGNIEHVSRTYNSGVTDTIILKSGDATVLEASKAERVMIWSGAGMVLKKITYIQPGDCLIKDLSKVKSVSVKGKVVLEGKKIGYPKSFNSNVAYLVGLLVAGVAERGEYKVSFSNEEVLDRFIKSIRWLFKVDPQKVKHMLGYSVSFEEFDALRDFYIEYVGDYSLEDKKVPEILWEVGYDEQFAFVQGVCDVCGEVEQTCTRLRHHSENLLAFVKNVLEAYGYNCSLIKDDNVWFLEVYGIEKPYFRLESKIKQIRFGSERKQYYGLPDNCTIVVISDVEQGRAQTFDITNDGSHLFSANGVVVHNSSLFRAMATAVFNLPRESHISYGKSACAVGIALNGHTVVYKRDKNKASSVSYVVDGKSYGKVGRGPFDKVAEALNIKEVDMDTFKVQPNFAVQMSYPFMLDKTPGQIFKFMASSSESGRLLEIQEQMKKDLSSMTSEIKDMESRKEVIKDHFNTEKAKYDALLKYKDKIKKILSLDGDVQNLEILKGRISDLASIDKKSIERALKEIEKELKPLEGVAAEELESFQKLEALCDSLKKIYIDRAYLEGDIEISDDKLKKTLGLEYNAARLDELKSLQGLLSDLDSVLSKESRFTEEIGSIKIVDPDCDITGLEALQRLIESLSGEVEIQGVLTHDISSVDESIGDVEKELSEFDVCPYCGSILKNKECCKEE